MTAAREDYRLERHPRYGFWQIRPTPSAEAITRYYAEEFYAADYRGCNDSALETVARDRAFYETHYADILQTVEQLAGRPAAGLHLLDVGCGWCQALAYWQRRGVVGHGFDPAPEAVAHGCGLGLEVRHAGMERMDVFGCRFDAVTLLNVLEHLADPLAVIRELRERVIESGGVLVVDVPNEFNDFQTAARAVLDLPEWWVAPPAHLNYFSGDSLKALLEDHGFAVMALEASFPLELFLLMGDRYVGDPELGRRCHEKRMAFEANLRAQGRTEKLRGLYRALAELNLGRQVVAFAVAV